MKKESPLVSVIIPVYNTAQYLNRCFDSVVNQTYKNIEVYVIDDGSTDNSASICDAYGKRYPNFHILHKKNGGLSSARNVALDLITGEYITFLDSDDFFHIKFIEYLVSLCVNNGCEIAQCSFLRGSSWTYPSIDNKKSLLKVYSNRDIFISYQANIIVCAKLYKASLWNDVRMPLGKKNEDEYVTWKIYYKAHKIAVSTVPLYYYFSNPESIMSSNSTFLNLYYIGAYNERINFFKSVNDVDMLIMSQIQFCKELSLSYFKMRELNEKEKAKYVHDIYSNNVLDIMNSPLLTMSLRFYFRIFNFSPKLAYLCLKIIKQYK